MSSNHSKGDILRCFFFFSFINILRFYVFILSFALDHSFNFNLFIFFLSLSLFIFYFYNLLYCIKCNNNKFQSSSLDESSARLMTNFSTSLSQRLSLAQYSASTFFTYSQTDRNRSAVMVLNPSSAVFRRITHLSKSSTIMTIGCTFRVAGGYILSGIGIRDAVVEARSSGGVVTDWEL